MSRNCYKYWLQQWQTRVARVQALLWIVFVSVFIDNSILLSTLLATDPRFQLKLYWYMSNTKLKTWCLVFGPKNNHQSSQED